jgi:hypothetical protein
MYVFIMCIINELRLFLYLNRLYVLGYLCLWVIRASQLSVLLTTVPGNREYTLIQVYCNKSNFTSINTGLPTVPTRIGNSDCATAIQPFVVPARSKTWVCGRSIAGNAGSNPAGDTDVSIVDCCVLWSRGLCVRLITRPDESYPVWYAQLSVIVKPRRGGPCPLGAVALVGQK